MQPSLAYMTAAGCYNHNFVFIPKNQKYTQPLKIPEKGLQLKTRIYVQVKATNLSKRYFFNIRFNKFFAHIRGAQFTSIKIFVALLFLFNSF